MAVSTDSVYLPTSDRCGFFMLKDYFQDVSPVYNNAVCVCVFTFAVFIFCLSSLPLACDILPTDCLTVQNSGLDYSWTSVSVCLCLSPVIVLKEMRGLQFSFFSFTYFLW